ncbi:hypothetical protein RIR_jg42550.t1 [Rhizophagus irregularis DAOM 181602=DAOM 197198]|nr:hypothetical protein RIR_jg42550.t1 [Rhizophagus irregularis DAOM 181602=DAOM 197198]CAB4474245.1 unnamed protein product [Rhizophagus irregularis]
MHIYKEQIRIVNGKLNPYVASYTIGRWLYGKCRTRLEIDKLEELAKVYQFNLSTVAEKFHKIQTKISSETMKNIAETVFNKFEEEAYLEESENAELPNPAEHFYTNEQDLNLDILNMINFQSLIFVITMSTKNQVMMNPVMKMMKMMNMM